ncbi:putative mitochondrial cardiolipin synthase [Cryptosporidium felis]|nr:putative mitochondrial cardiolipin synthase [Cryptosporidium felis]
MNINVKNSAQFVHDLKANIWLEEEVLKKLQERNIFFNTNVEHCENSKWLKLLNDFSKYGPITKGNRIKLFDNSRDAYLSMIESIDSAKERVWFETYIFEECEIGEKFIDSFCKASNRGCDVILLLDAFGSYKFPKRWVQALKNNKVKVIWFNPISQLFNVTVFFRNHRKLLISDNRAFCGSINVTNRVNISVSYNDANIYQFKAITYSKFKQFTLFTKQMMYFVSPLRFNRLCFYDVHAEIIGPATYDLGKVFIDSLKESRCDFTPELFKRPEELKEGTILQVLFSNTRREHRGIQNVLSIVTKNASHCINLTTPYFFPPNYLCKAIQTAINNDVKVSMLLSGKSDIPGDTIATKYLVKRFLYNNARFFFTRNIHCHAKYITIDGIWSSFGSFNWDGFSTNRNLEVSVASFDPKIANQLIEMQTKMTHSFQSTEQTILKWREESRFVRTFSKIAYIVIRFINKF